VRITLEGVDGVGKTTLATAIYRLISETYPDDAVQLEHYGPPKQHPLVEYALDQQDYRPGLRRHVVCDRLHWGELVYGPLYRDKSELDGAGFRFVELLLLARGAVTWHVTADLDTIYERVDTRGDDYVLREDLALIKSRYDKLETQSATFAGRVDTLRTPVEVLARELVTQAEYYENAAQRLNRYPSYIGRPTPSVVLFGEKRGGQPPYPTTAAFYPERKAGSAATLLEALPDAYWRTAGIANVLEEPDVKGLLETLGEPKVVALGRVADRALTELGVPHGTVPHPQYVKRFYNKYVQDYGVLIEETARSGEDNGTWPK